MYYMCEWSPHNGCDASGNLNGQATGEQVKNT